LGEKFADEESAEVVVAACRDKKVTVHLVERKEKTLSPPKLFDLTEVQREANRRFGFTAQQTLDYAQSLYEKALISYPRTDSRFITSDMNNTASDLVELARKLPEYGKLEFAPNMDKIINDAKVSDHHAILPTNKALQADISALHAGESKVLTLLISRLLCAVAPLHRYESVTAVLKCGGHFFTAKGKSIIERGWSNIDVYSRDDGEPSDSELPALIEGQELKKEGVIVKEGASAPQKHFTDSTLLGAMESAGAEDLPDDAERRGLGTPATRANLLERLIKSGFVERQKKNLIPTEKGKNLIAVLPDALTSPMLTAEWEHKLCQIQRGELSEAEFIQGISSFIKTIIAENNTPKPEYINLFSGGKPQNEPLGGCPRCGASVREGGKGFFCDTQTCGFKLWKQSKFWTAKKKPLTAAIVTALLKDGSVALTGLHSEKSDKMYDATVILDDTGGEFVNFKLSFENGKRG
jgi:DNA topoisomerase-3